MPSPSPHMAHASPRASSGSVEALRPALAKRNSSQSSKGGALSPGSANEHHHLVKPRKTKIVLPRGHGSGRNLAKLGRQAQIHNAGAEGRKHTRQRSHEGDTEIRLPGSLDEGKRMPLRRNLTSSQLPRNTSHTKLKKNLSHGQLTRLGSGKNLAGLSSTASKGPPSPGLKARAKRTKSADKAELEKDLHEQEVEVAQQQQEQREGPKRVGFIVSSSGEDDEDDAPQMEGSGLQDDEWTDQSASASPLSTRQNTANNSRRASVTIEKPPSRTDFTNATKANIENVAQEDHAAAPKATHENERNAAEREDEDESEVEDDVDDDEESPPSPPSIPQERQRGLMPPPPSQQSPAEPKRILKSPLHLAKEHPNPATRHLLSRSSQSPAPALVSNVSALDDVRSDLGVRASPTPSMISSRSNIGESSTEHVQDELVSRFIPSASHPSMGSGGNTAMNTPKTSSLHTPENESILAAQHRDKSATSLGPVSPGSTLSASSGTVTPKARSRNEQKLINEKIRADMEDAAALQPIIPPHVFDRRNESLKSYLSSTTLADGKVRIAAGAPGFNLGPDLFQGRFKAVNTELKVVQKFRDPIKESLSRLQQCKETKSARLRTPKTSPQKQQAAKVPISKSSLQLSRQTSKLSTSTSPPRSTSPVKPAISSARSSTQINRPSESRRGKVTFSQTPAETRELERSEDRPGADAIARQLWEGVFG